MPKKAQRCKHGKDPRRCPRCAAEAAAANKQQCAHERDPKTCNECALIRMRVKRDRAIAKAIDNARRGWPLR